MTALTRAPGSQPGASEGVGSAGDRSRRRATWLGLAVALAVIVAGLVVLLSPTDWRTVQLANVLPSGPVSTLAAEGDRACTGLGEVPADAGYAELHVQGAPSVRARLSVESGSDRWVTATRRVAVENGVLRFPLPDRARTSQPALLCLELAASHDPAIQVLGTGEVPAMRLVGEEPQSRLEQLPAMLGRLFVGTGWPLGLVSGWVFALLAFATLAGALALVVRAWASDRGPGRRTWIAIAVIGVLHAWLWAAAVPAFQVPDENSHFHYATYVADHKRLPSDRVSDEPPASVSQQIAEQQLQTMTITFRPTMRPAWAASTDEAVDRALDGASLAVADTHTNATGQPPLYYLSVAPAALGGGTALDQLARMRLLSGLWMAVAVLGAVALVCALTPARPRWAVVAGLAVALLPLLGFLAGGVSPDVAMVALSFWVFATAVRCWTAGLSPGRVAGFGLAVALLMLTKLTVLAVVPGALLIVLAAAVRDGRRGDLRGVLRALAIGVGVAAIPLVLYALMAVASDRPLLPRVIGAVVSDTTTAATGTALSTGGRIHAVWQLFLPRLPGQPDVFAGTPLWTVWADGLAGRFGYLDYGFEEGARRIIAFGWLLVVAAAVVGFGRLVRRDGVRDVLRRFGPVLVGGAVAVVLLMAVIGVIDYNSRSTNGPPFQQARYLLPGLPVALIAVPLALRAFGPRTRPVVAVAMVGLMVLWATAALGLTLVRYYG